MAGLREAGQTPATAPAPCAPGAPTPRPGPQRSQIPGDQLLIPGSGSPPPSGPQERAAGMLPREKASGSEEIVSRKGRVYSAFLFLGTGSPARSLPR